MVIRYKSTDLIVFVISDNNNTVQCGNAKNIQLKNKSLKPSDLLLLVSFSIISVLLLDIVDNICENIIKTKRGNNKCKKTFIL